MRIALLTDGIYPHVIGGMQKHSFYLAKYFAQNKINVDLYHPITNTENAFLKEFSSEESKYIHPIFVKFPKSVYFPGHYIYESYKYSKNIFEKYIQRKPVDFIYAQGFCGWEMIKQKKGGIDSISPIGINFHGLNMFQKAFDLRTRLNNVLFKPAVKFNLLYTDYTFSLGGKLSSLIYKVANKRSNIIEIPVGVDLSWLTEENKLKNNKPLSFVFVGRYDKVKGIDILNNAIKNLVSDKKLFEVNLIGPFPSNLQLKYNNVRYYGEIKDIHELKELLTKNDVLISSSYSEGMPTVIIEAMACGLAVIATDVGAVSELIDEKNGILISPGKTKALEDAILKFSGFTSEKIIMMKKQSIKKVKQHYLWSEIIRKTIVEIEKIVANKKNDYYH